ncbi:unnamed protein product [Medioppia subpectinata]|uniref:C2 domain-containing protein n=1 Tax=Medioppia subpectinata TaxID=1979941 RepID=A0A7R9LDT1_9ACAR|nr:unnamed protein product [Medioppia subpectinata]CAG2117899.1 unnamed protein product [Medioppia subpectinata]
MAQPVRADDPLAQAKCRSLHHVDVDAQGTQYTNDKCELDCVIHGAVNHHNMSEGLPCPGIPSTKNTCIGGKCVSPLHLGYIDIEMTSADLSKAATAYADVCLQNASTVVELPIIDRKTCVSCQTAIAPTSTHPTWRVVCQGSHKFIWKEESRVTFEVWDHVSSVKNNFAGGATLLITQLIEHHDSHKPIALPLARGDNSGKISVTVTWTPK